LTRSCAYTNSGTARVSLCSSAGDGFVFLGAWNTRRAALARHEVCGLPPFREKPRKDGTPSLMESQGRSTRLYLFVGNRQKASTTLVNAVYSAECLIANHSTNTRPLDAIYSLYPELQNGCVQT
jgi:hypothetical protein